MQDHVISGKSTSSNTPPTPPPSSPVPQIIATPPYRGAALSALHSSGIPITDDYSADYERRFFKAVKSNDENNIKQLLREQLTQPKKSAILDYRYFINPKERNVLMVATRHRAYNSMKFILANGIEIDARNKRGRTALHSAVMNRDAVSVGLLLHYSASLTCKDNDGYTPLALAKAMGYEDIMLQLEEVSHYNYHAEFLSLHHDIQSLTSGEDIISKVSYQLESYLKKEVNISLEKLNRQLLQPEELLCAMPKTGSKKKPKKDKRDALDQQATPRFSYDDISKEEFSQLPLTQDSPLFSEINALMAEIDRINQELQEMLLNQKQFQGTSRQSIQDIRELLTKAKEYYLSFQKAVCSSQGEERIKLCESRARLRGSIGFYYLNAGAELRFSRFFNSEETAKPTVVGAKDNTYGTHAVMQLGNTHYKIRPSAPGAEHAFHSLNTIISGQGSAPTELLVFKKGKKAFPVLASQSVQGENFEEVLQQHPEWVNKMDAYNYTAHFVLSLLALPSDGKPDNYMALLEWEQSGGAKISGNQVKSLKLVGIDNDLAFDTPYLTAKKTVHFAGLKAVFFCMPQIDHRLDANFRQAFLNQSPALILLKWLKELVVQEKHYLEYRNHLGKEEFKNIRLPLAFLPGTFQGVYERLKKLQSLMKNPKIIHAKLLEGIYPALAFYYAHARKEKANISECYGSFIHNGPYIENVPNITPQMLEELSTYSRNSDDILRARTETLSEAAERFIEQLVYPADIYIQGYILEKIGADFPMLTRLTFNNVEALTDERLAKLAQNMHQLQALTLVDCVSFEGSGLSALLCCHPEIQLTIQGIEHLTSQNLIALLKHSRDLILRINGTDYKLKEKDTRRRLLEYALSHKQYNALVTALLAMGTHLEFKRGEQSPLHLAIREKNEAAVRKLIHYGASLDELNHEEKSPLDLALELYNEGDATAKSAAQAIMLHLLSAGANATKAAKAVLVSIQAQVGKLPLNSAERLFCFIRTHNLLTAKWIAQLNLPDLTSFDLRPQARLASVTLDEALLDAIHQRFPKLKVLYLQGCDGLTPLLFSKLLAWKLETIVMDFHQAENSELVNLDELDQCVNLRKGSTEIQITHVCFRKRKFKQLSSDQLFNLSVFIRNNKHLKVLDLATCDLEMKHISCIADAIASNLLLETVTLSHNPLGDEGVDILLKALQEQPPFSKLHTLYLENTGMGIKSATTLGQLLEKHTSLNDVRLYNNPLGDEGVMTIAAGLKARSESKKSGVLKRLSLNEVGMGESGAKALVESLFLLKTLVYLDVGHNSRLNENDKAVLCFVTLLELNLWLTDFRCGGVSDQIKQKFGDLIEKNRQRDRQASLQAIHLHSQPGLQPRVKPILPPEYFEIKNLEVQNRSLQYQLQATKTSTATTSSNISNSSSFFKDETDKKLKQPRPDTQNPDPHAIHLAEPKPKEKKTDKGSSLTPNKRR